MQLKIYYDGPGSCIAKDVASCYAAMSSIYHEPGGDMNNEDKHEVFSNDTLSAWRDYEATGLDATAEEVVS